MERRPSSAISWMVMEVVVTIAITVIFTMNPIVALIPWWQPVDHRWTSHISEWYSRVRWMEPGGQQNAKSQDSLPSHVVLIQTEPEWLIQTHALSMVARGQVFVWWVYAILRWGEGLTTPTISQMVRPGGLQWEKSDITLLTFQSRSNNEVTLMFLYSVW